MNLLNKLNNFLIENKGDDFEKKIVDLINNFSNFKAIKSTNTKYSDVKIESTTLKKSAWLECKLNHSAQTFSVRLRFINGKWQAGPTSKPSEALDLAIKTVNDNSSDFIEKICQFISKENDVDVNKNNLIINTTTSNSDSSVKTKFEVSRSLMEKFLKNIWGNQYLFKLTNFNVGELTRKHYQSGKNEQVDYIQIGEKSFYKIIDNDTFKLSNDIPLLNGTGIFAYRIRLKNKILWSSTRSKTNKYCTN